MRFPDVPLVAISAVAAAVVVALEAMLSLLPGGPLPRLN
jgi:hypothetical protein